MDQLPTTFRNAPRSAETLARVQDGLRKLSEKLSITGQFLIVASDSTVQRDIYQLGYRHGGRTGRVTK